MNDYDEDLKANPFYSALLDHHAELESASRQDWIICVPRAATVRPPIERADIRAHILVPGGARGTFTTLADRVVRVTADGRLEVIGREADRFGVVRVLFAETFYHHQLKYKVYCIEFPLDRRCAQLNPIHTVANLRDCVDLLWIETYGRDVFARIGDECQRFLDAMPLEDTATIASLETVQTRARHLYETCLQIPLRCGSLRAKARADRMLAHNIRLAVETFAQHALAGRLFAYVRAATAHDDANFNKVTRNLQDLQAKSLRIASFQEHIADARAVLAKLDQYTTTLGKLQCLRCAFASLARTNRAREVLSGETLVQLLAFLIVKLNVNDWLANLTYMRDFMFSHGDAQDASSYLLTSLEAAIEHVRSNALLEKLNADIDDSEHSVIVAIRNCDLDRLKRAFPHAPSRSNEDEDNERLCHPLCSCDACESRLAVTRSDRHTYIDQVDEKGRNCLHVACMYGYPQIVDFLLHERVAHELADYAGARPIHYTALRGHLKTMLLLAHAGAALNVTNADGNTPLHLAANNGHENCVKGLLYYAEHQRADAPLDVNTRNACGESALHLAARWGYASIVSILLDHGIDHAARNRRNECAMDVAHGGIVKQLIASCSHVHDAPTTLVRRINASARDFACDADEKKAYGVRPTNFEQFKRADLLLRAIENNDLPLSCFYLGIPAAKPLEEEDAVGNSSSSVCHPLCDCSGCHSVETSGEGRGEEAEGQLEKLHVNICNSEGFTPLHVAAQYGRNELVRLLLDAGADCNLQTYAASYTPLHVACVHRRAHAAKELLLSGACDADAQDGRGNAPLHYACANNDARIVDVLLAHGADTTVRNAAGRTPLRLAQERSLFAVASAIREKGREIRSFYVSEVGVGELDEELV